MLNPARMRPLRPSTGPRFSNVRSTWRSAIWTRLLTTRECTTMRLSLPGATNRRMGKSGFAVDVLDKDLNVIS